MTILIKYGELTTKGDNRRQFINKLSDNIKDKLKKYEINIIKNHSRMFIEFNDIYEKEIVNTLRNTFGIHAFNIVYKVNTNSAEDIRKILFAKCAEKGITILESRQIEASLEDAFMELISDRPELSQKEIKKIQYEREIEELRQEEIEAKELRESKRIAKKEEKARKNAKKESLKQAKENEKEEKVEEPKDDTDEEAEEDEGGDK